MTKNELNQSIFDSDFNDVNEVNTKQLLEITGTNINDFYRDELNYITLIEPNEKEILEDKILKKAIRVKKKQIKLVQMLKPTESETEDESEEESEEEIVIKKKRKVKEVKPPPKKRTIVIEVSSSESESDEEPPPPKKQRAMVSQQNRKSIIKVHRQEPINYFAD